MRSWRLPPTFIPATPSSQPLITLPAPNGNSKGLPVPTELSNFLPVVSQPVYSTLTVLPASAVGPVPTLMSQYCSPDGVLVPSPVTLVGPVVAGRAAAVDFFAVV